MKHNGDTITKLVATNQQALDLAFNLTNAAEKAGKTGETRYVRIILEQMTHDGPWKLVIAVAPAEAEGEAE